MANKKKYYPLDDVGIVGKQDKKSPGVQNYHKKKTGEAIRQLREGVYVHSAPKNHAKRS